MAKRIIVVATAIGISVLSFLLSEKSFAQGNTWSGKNLAQMVESARWTIGALRINSALTLENAGYDTDVYFGYLSKAAPDFTLSTSLPTQILLPVGKKIVLDVFDSPQYNFCLDTKKERGWNNIFRGQLHFALERFYIRGGASLANVRERLSPELNINVREREDRFNGTLLWQTSRRTSLAVLYETSRYKYGEAILAGSTIAESLNRREDHLDVLSYFEPNPRVRISLDGQYSNYVFEDLVSSFKDARSFSFFGGVTFLPPKKKENPRAPIEGSIILGYKRFDILDPLFVDGSSIVAAVDVSVGLFPKMIGHAYATRDFLFSVYSSGTYYLSTTYGGGISRQFSRHVTFIYDLFFSRSDYPVAEGGGESPDQNYFYTTHSLKLDVGLARNLRITFLGTLSKRTMKESGVVNDRDFFGISFVYGFPANTMLAPVRGTTR